MPSLWQPEARARLRTRLAALRPDAGPLWGKMNAQQMLAHVNDALRMATGELPVKPRKLPVRFWPIKQLMIYVLPFPKGVPTARELLARIDGAQFAQETAAFPAELEKFASQPAHARLPAHPAFGPLTRRAWGVLAYRHVDHHFRQFGV
jgi:hypothetical protein